MRQTATLDPRAPRRPDPASPSTRARHARRRAGWRIARSVVYAATLAVLGLLVARPALGLTVWWGLIVPVLPAVFLVAPGLWRNLCPLATSNQLPRWLGLSRARSSRWLSQGSGYYVGLCAFVAAVIGRKAGMDADAAVTAGAIGLMLGGALLGGLVFKGKSGWCSTICPLLPVQRLYGQQPFVTVAHAHCQPCVGCAKNCLDVDPRRAQLADQYDGNRRHRSARRLFAAAFPGFVLGFFLVPGASQTGVVAMLADLGLFVAVSLTLFHVVDALVVQWRNLLPAAFGALGFDIYYWFGAPTIVQTLNALGADLDPSFAVAIRTTALLASATWLLRVVATEQEFLDRQLNHLRAGTILPVPVVVEALMDRAGGTGAGGGGMRLALDFDPVPGAGGATPAPAAGLIAPVTERSADAPAAAPADAAPVLPAEHRVQVAAGASVLETLEGAGVTIASGCRMGQCGADPVHVVEGADALLAIGDDERRTLARSGCPAGTRLACMARTARIAEIGLRLGAAPEPAAPAGTATARAPDRDPSADPGQQRRIVVIGAGVAGASAALAVRRQDAQAHITLIGAERRTPYNRMAIASLLADPGEPARLALFAPDWFDRQRVFQKTGCAVVAIDRAARRLMLANGEAIKYDCLVLATGARAWVPPLAQFDGTGAFVMRQADDVIALRAYLTGTAPRRAAVIGAGLLGLEAARALADRGLQVTVVSNTARAMDRQADEASSRLLLGRLARRGIDFVGPVAVTRVLRSDLGRVRGLLFDDGRVVCCDLVLACAGVKADVDLAKSAGLAVNRGVVVDAAMRTSDPAIFACGDVAEHDGQCAGLWANALAQADVAGANAAGGDAVHRASPPITVLKVGDVDFRSYGVPAAEAGDVEVVAGDRDGQRYRKLVLRGAVVVGAILVDEPGWAGVVAARVADGVPLTAAQTAALRGGDWSVLGDPVTAAGAPHPMDPQTAAARSVDGSARDLPPARVERPVSDVGALA